MNWIDWLVLVTTLTGIAFYGLRKMRNSASDADNFLSGGRELKWYTIGLSIMATQASAVTFLSTPGQAFTDGMRFVQFYFGMPLAMIFLAVFVLPIFYKLNVKTAYEFLENRFDLRMRSFTAILFLLQRSISAAISIYAPSLILSAVFGWDLLWTNAFMGIFVLFYTILGGSRAVSKTQELQMAVILIGLVISFFVILYKLPPEISLGDALHVAGSMGKTNAVNFNFDLKDRYNFWSGVLGATFLFLSYFGTDQSQVGRYLGGKTLTESRLGLLFNGLFKIPMQFLVLLTGVMVFVFYQFTPSPIHFHENNLAAVSGKITRLEQRNDSLFLEKKAAISELLAAHDSEIPASRETAQKKLQLIENQVVAIRKEANEIVQKNVPNAPKTDTDYIFLNFVLNHLPVGLIGLMIAVIFCASWSTTASELNALTTTTVSDIYRRSLVKHRDDAHYLSISKYVTMGWGVFILLFAMFVNLPENLIQMVNKFGSLFYGTVLGIFFTAFFLKKVGSRSVFWAALWTMFLIGSFWIFDVVTFLWWNPIGCFSVMILSWILEKLIFSLKKN